MMRALPLLAVSVLSLTIVTAAGAPVAVAAPLDYFCTEDDVRRLIEDAGPTQQDPAVLTSFEHCQFRLYDENDGETPDSPEVPHTFSDDEWFMGGILTWVTKEELKAEGLTKKQAIDFMDSIVDRLFFGEVGGPLVEIPLLATEYRKEHGPDPGDKWLIINHRYHVFQPGSLPPGTYEWRWEASFEDAEALEAEARGTVVITEE